MHQGSVTDLALAVLCRAPGHASPAHQGDASEASGASEPAADGHLYIRAEASRQCASCRNLEARGVAILHCSECDVLTHGPEDCPRCQRLGARCRDQIGRAHV